MIYFHMKLIPILAVHFKTKLIDLSSYIVNIVIVIVTLLIHKKKLTCD